MNWFIVVLSALFIAAGLAGYYRVIQIIHLNRKRVFGGFLILLFVLTLMTAASWFGIFTQNVAIRVTMAMYTIAAGFFVGYSAKMVQLRRKSSQLEYMYRSTWIDVAPNLVAVALFVFGIFRTGIITGGPFTGIGITSGISLISFALLGWTVHIIPEFRHKGILLLDQYIKWKKVVTFDWVSENTLRVEYVVQNGKLSEFRTYIPDEDKSIIERILREKIDENKEARKELLDVD